MNSQRTAKIWTIVLGVLTIAMVVVFFRKPPEARTTETNDRLASEDIRLRRTPSTPRLTKRGRDSTGPLPPGTTGPISTSLTPAPPRTTRPDGRYQPRESRMPEEPRFHRVVDGDTLRKISRMYFGTEDRAEEIFHVNRNSLNHADLLPLGVRLMIPTESDPNDPPVEPKTAEEPFDESPGPSPIMASPTPIRETTAVEPHDTPSEQEWMPVPAASSPRS